MWNFLILCSLLWSFSLQSKLMNFLSTTDQFFQEFQLLPDNSILEVENLKLLIQRSYDLNDEKKFSHDITKRSLEQGGISIRDNKGVYLLSGIRDVVKIPARFPNDINVISSHNILYITTIDANGTNPQYQLANDMVLFQYSSIQGIKEIGRVPVLGGKKIAMYFFQNITYLVTAEYDAQYNPNLFQGSTIYKLLEQKGKIYLEKMQILNVLQPNDLKFWEHQSQLYLAVGTEKGNDTQRSGILIYRWLGYHFDCLQVIPSKSVKSVTPFKIGSFMFLAVANFQDEYGNPDTDSEIFQFSLEEMKFKLYQKIRTHGALDFSYFNFEDVKTRNNEHFLIVANSIKKNLDENLSSLTESVLYKFNNNHFIPFQSFKILGITQWLPIQGANGEFLLLGSCSYGVIGYQYDGWRFMEVSLQFGQADFGSNISSMRYFTYFGDIFLTIADKNSYGNKINMWKLEFMNKNMLEKQYKEFQTWCEETRAQMDSINYDEAINELDFVTDKTPKKLKRQIETENLKAGDFYEESHDELEALSEKVKNLEEKLKEIEEDLEHYKSNSEHPIVIGLAEIASLEVNCDSQDCCKFKNLKILKLNGKNYTEFYNEIVLLDEDIRDAVLEFEHVVYEDNLPSSMVNGHPAETLVDASSTTLINADLLVNGTVFVEGYLNVDGLFNGFLPDEDHILLKEKPQDIRETISIDILKVKNLNLFGKLNSENIERLLRQPETDLANFYEELNVNNISVDGFVNGHNLSQLFYETLKISGNQKIYGDLAVKRLEVQEVIVEDNQISNISVSAIALFFENYFCKTNIENSTEENDFDHEIFRAADSGISAEDLWNPSEIIIIVEGFLKANDIFDENNSISLLNVLNNSYKLNDLVIESNFQFFDVVADNLRVEVINETPFNSWVRKNSNYTQIIQGKKIFKNDIVIQKEVAADTINGINLKKFEQNILTLDEYQVISHDMQFDTIKCQEIQSNFTYLGHKLLQQIDQIDQIDIQESISTIQLQVENLTIYGDIDSFSWDNILEDSVFDLKDVISGEKIIKRGIQVKNLNIDGNINDLLMDEFIMMTSKDANKILFDTNVKLNSSLNVEELLFEGFLNSILKSNFEHEWLLADETQIITGPIVFENMVLKSGCTLMNETINNISLRKLFTKSLKINQDTKVKYLFGMDKISAERIEVSGTLNAANFKESVVYSKDKPVQEIFGEWFLSEGLVVNGALAFEGSVSGLNISHLCSLNPSEKINLTVEGFIKMNQEPKVIFHTNGIDIMNKLKEVWIKTENVTLKGQNIKFGNVLFENKTILGGFLNNANLTHLSKYYLSKTKNSVISGDFEFKHLVIENSCRMHTAAVGGSVNGVDLEQWTKNVVLQGEEQIFEEKLHFEIFETSDLTLEGNVNGMNLSKDILRMDVEEAFVEGEKTFQSVNVLNVTLVSGKCLQEVDIDYWRKSLIKTTGDYTIKGDLTFENVSFNGPFKVHGKVQDIQFDSNHLLTIHGNQVVTGFKRFNSSKNPNHSLKIKFFEVSGPINGVNLNELLRDQAYSNQNLTFTKPKTLIKGLTADFMEFDGLFHSINVSRTCYDVSNPININSKKEDFDKLVHQTKTLIDVVKDRAFFFDYFELIQTLKSNVKAVVPTVDISFGNYLLAVFTPKIMRFMDWNDYSESFTNTDEGLVLNDNVTFVTSETSKNRSLLYIETTKSAKIFEPQFLKEIQSTDTSCVASFPLKSLNKSCIFIGQKSNISRILCNSFVMNDLQTYQKLDSKGSIQVTVLNIENEVYIAAINKEEVFDKIENTLSIYQFDEKLQHFHVSHTLAEINPVAVSSISYNNNHYLVSAGGHLPESVHNSVLSIFKFNKHHKVFIRSQSIRVDTPIDVHFAVLPSSQLALYVLTSNPTKPFVVFLHKGISGFVEETSGLSLYSGSNLYSFTDSRNQHFVVISGFGRGQILRAGFKGNKP